MINLETSRSGLSGQRVGRVVGSARHVWVVKPARHLLVVWLAKLVWVAGLARPTWAIGSTD